MIKVENFTGQKCWRIIPSRYPTINLFERVTAPEDLEAIFELESLTNDRLRESVGDLSLVPPEHRISGPNTSFIMAAFTHLPPQGSRFTDGTYGVYYAGMTLETAISETKYHREKFLRYTKEDPLHLDMRVLTARLRGDIESIAGTRQGCFDLYHSTNYKASQEFARIRRAANGNGIFYDSVRHEGGRNVAVFKPNLLSKCLQAQHLDYLWDGEKISAVFEKKRVA